MMPRMRGTIASATIRGLGYQGVIIGVTGNALEDDVADFKKHGVDVVMPKPFEIETFKKHYRRLCAPPINCNDECGVKQSSSIK